MHANRRTVPVVAGILALTVGPSACGSDAEQLPRTSSLVRDGWFGSVQGWGLLGLAKSGGALAYRSAGNLSAPTWAPPELKPIAEGELADGGIWILYGNGELVSFDYSTGRILSFDRLPSGSRLATSFGDSAVIVVSPDSGSISAVGESDRWDFELPGILDRLISIGEGRLVASVDRPEGAEILVLHPPEEEPEARLSVSHLRDLDVTAWSTRLYYLPGSPTEEGVRAVSLPDLEPAGGFELAEAGQALAFTPSGHRLYVAAGRTLNVFDRLTGERIGRLELPSRLSALRFGTTGTVLLGRVEGQDQVIVARVGVDTILGVLVSEWDRRLPAALPGGRLVTGAGDALILYELPTLTRIARVEDASSRIWFPVEWEPPRPRMALVHAGQRTVAGSESREARARADTAIAVDSVPDPGYYAVVQAARSSQAVDSLVRWLRDIGYPAKLVQHRDAMGVLWYRAMVGPYRNRPRAEGAARRLSARYAYKPWILGIEDRPEDAESVRDSVESAWEPSADAEPRPDVGRSRGP